MEHLLWLEHDRVRFARWGGADRVPRPAAVLPVDDTLRAADALDLARRDHGLLWRGDYHNACRLLAAMRRRIDRTATARDFAAHRRHAALRARLLSRVVVELGPGHRLDLRRAPDVAEACTGAFGTNRETTVLPLTEVLGAVSAHRWRMHGVHVRALGARIHPHHGVFPPTRQDYLDLVATLTPTARTAFDIGTGTGVLAALLARHVPRTVATDVEPRAVECARENIRRLGLADRVEVVEADLFPPGRADLVVCNPPWLPGEPSSPLDAAVFDPGSAMLRGFLHGLGDHLAPGGEAWLVMSDLAERLGLRPPLRRLVAEAGLVVADRVTAGPHRRRRGDGLSRHRSAEQVSVWRLTRRAAR